MIAAMNKAASAAGKASASVRAVFSALPNKINPRAGAAVMSNSAVTITPAASSNPLVAGSDPDMNIGKATTAHSAASEKGDDDCAGSERHICIASHTQKSPLATLQSVSAAHLLFGGRVTAMFPPSRIVCLTEETLETLYLLGEQDRIPGISGYVVRPPQARREKPRVSAFTSANIDKILALEPDLVLTFSDLQAHIAAELIRRGIEVHAFNQRTVAGILDMIRMVGAMVGASERAEELVRTLEIRLAEARHRAECLTKRPTVFFEEWDGPLISAIGWVSELVEIAGGIDIFADRSNQGAAKDRVVTADEVVARQPDIIIG